MFTSPLVDISSLNNPELEYYFHNFALPTSNFRQPLYVDIYDGSVWHNKVHDIDTVFQSSSADPWKDTIIDLNPYSSNGIIQVRFRTKITRSAGGGGDVSIDDVRISDPISCPAPGALASNPISPTSAEITWDTAGVGALSYEVEYGLAGFALGTGTSATATGNSYTITGLTTTNLCQEVYVRALCGTDSSLWVGPIGACPEVVPCDNIDNYVANANFNQSALFLPWQNGGASVFGNAAFSTTRSASAPNSLWVNKIGTAPDADLVAYFDTIDSGAWRVSFDMFVESGAGAYFNIQQNHAYTSGTNYWGGELYFQGNGTVSVEYANPTINVGTFPYAQGQWISVATVIDLANDTIWIEYNGTSTGLGWQYSAANPTVPLQFNAVNFYSGVQTGQTYNIDFYVDNFCVTPYVPGVCAAPSGLSVGSIHCDTAQANWISPSTNSNTILEWGTTGFTLGTGTKVNFISSPYNFTGLTPNTAYDVYVADTCAGDTSAWVGPVTFTTLPVPTIQASFTFNQSRTGQNDANVDFDASGSTGANSYSWDFDNGSTGTDVNDSTQYTANGTYDVTLSITGDCGATDDTTITITVAGIDLTENALSNSLSIYPNPADGEVTIDFTPMGSSEATIRIMDMSGREVIRVEEKAINGNRHKSIVDVDRLVPGVYIIEINSGEQKARERLNIR